MSGYISDETAHQIALDMQNCFMFGNLHSQSTIPEIAVRVRDELLDRRITARRSLCLMIAKMALAQWHGTIMLTKLEDAT